jgi:hypothetical protein
VRSITDFLFLRIRVANLLYRIAASRHSRSFNGRHHLFLLRFLILESIPSHQRSMRERRRGQVTRVGVSCMLSAETRRAPLGARWLGDGAPCRRSRSSSGWPSSSPWRWLRWPRLTSLTVRVGKSYCSSLRECITSVMVLNILCIAGSLFQLRRLM